MSLPSGFLTLYLFTGCSEWLYLRGVYITSLISSQTNPLIGEPSNIRTGLPPPLVKTARGDLALVLLNNCSNICKHGAATDSTSKHTQSVPFLKLIPLYDLQSQHLPPVHFECLYLTSLNHSILLIRSVPVNIALPGLLKTVLLFHSGI